MDSYPAEPVELVYLSICLSVEILIEKKRTKEEREKHERGN
jgi:hypothetical protein